MVACHSCPQAAHSNHTFSFLDKATSAGVRSPFRVGCHSAAAAGFRAANELPGFGIVIALVAHFLQDAPAARLDTCACHSFWQLRHNHQTLLLLAYPTSEGVRSPFKVGCHSAATSGSLSAKDSPGRGAPFAFAAARRPHWGHP